MYVVSLLFMAMIAIACEPNIGMRVRAMQGACASCLTADVGSSLDFGSSTIGGSSIKSVILTPAKDLPAHDVEISIEGDGFSLIDATALQETNICGNVISEACTITVAFSPTSSDPHTGNLIILYKLEHSDSPVSLSIKLNGLGSAQGEDESLPLYGNTAIALTSGVAMSSKSPDTSFLDGAKVNSYSVQPALPKGLILNQATGQISGTPVGWQSLTSYTVKAQLANKAVLASLKIQITAPAGYCYSEASSYKEASPGPGTTAQPHLICAAAQLASIANDGEALKLNFKLKQNIDMSTYYSKGGTPFMIGDCGAGTCDDNDEAFFSGTLDGAGFTISNFAFNDATKSDVGLFRRIINGTITNLRLTNVSVNGSSYVGALAGQISKSQIKNVGINSGNVTASTQYLGGMVGATRNQSLIRNCFAHINLTMPSSGSAGGLVGMLGNYGRIEDSYATGDITGTGNIAGGLVGYLQRAAVYRSYADGNLTVIGDYVGGLVGNGEWISSGIYFSHATGAVEGTKYVGGLAGWLGRVTFGSYATGAVTGHGQYVGGLVGNGAEIYHSYATGTVVGDDSYVGGLAGLVVVAENSYATGSVTGAGQFVGGLIGDTDSSGKLISGTSRIKDSYATGNVSGGSTYVGGLVGHSRVEIINSFATGHVESETASTTYVGPISGTAAVGGYQPITNSFFLDTATCDSSKATAGIQACNTRGTSATSVQLFDTTQAPTASWDLMTETTNGVYDVWVGQTSLPPMHWYTAGITYTPPFLGTGTHEDPFQISSTADFNAIGSHPKLITANYILTTNLDFNSITFTPVGKFSGTFNGQGYTLQNITINVASGAVCPFGSPEAGAQLFDFSLTNASLSTASGSAGGISCLLMGIVRDVSVSGSISGTGNVGGISGSLEGSITNVSVSGSITSTGNNIGGIVGFNRASGIYYTSCSANVTGAINVGGITGYNWYAAVYDSYATGTVTATNNSAGGIVGINQDGGITNSYFSGNIEVTTAKGGGVVGWNHGASATVLNSFTTGSVGPTSGATPTDMGLLVGSNPNSGPIIDSYYYSGASCSPSCTTAGTAEANLTTFNLKSSSPLNLWDFDSIWQEQTNALPVLLD